jgi:DNA mismatch repair protein MutS
MPFHSILFDTAEARAQATGQDEPDFFVDLNLDQVVDSITASRAEYDLKPFFYATLHNVDAVKYRHEVLRDLESEPLYASITSFSRGMRSMREHLTQANKLHYTYQKESWFLDAIEVYCDTVNSLADELTHMDVGSRGLSAFREYLRDYVGSDPFMSLLDETKTLKTDLSTIRYCLLVKGSSVKVCKYDHEDDYSAEVDETFEKFKQGAARDYRMKFRAYRDMNHVEAAVLDLVARLYPDIFATLDRFCDAHSDYRDRTIADFDREVQFYLAYLEHMSRLKSAGLTFCYPHVSDRSKQIRVDDTFDLALAGKLVSEKSPVVCNDFYLTDPERIFVVTGPNQGGKTTFARTVGQLHYLASIGCPVPGCDAHLFLFDRLFTHFEKEEDIRNLSGKLSDDLSRIHQILDGATTNSVIIMNESFTSTTLKDALFLGRKILQRIMRLDALCVYVTFVDELTRLGPSTVSVASTVVPDDPASRTFKIVRKPADGLAHAVAIAEKHGLTYENLKRRIAS